MVVAAYTCLAIDQGKTRTVQHGRMLDTRVCPRLARHKTPVPEHLSQTRLTLTPRPRRHALGRRLRGPGRHCVRVDDTEVETVLGQAINGGFIAGQKQPALRVCFKTLRVGPQDVRAVVLRIELQSVYVLSKWGELDEYEHLVTACPFRGPIEYWTLRE